MYCKNCGSKIYEHASVCPNCGTPTEASNTPSENNSSQNINGLAIAGLIFAFLSPIVGLICSIIAAKQISKNNERGSNLALAGIIISIIVIIAAIVSIIIMATTLI